MEEHYLGKIKYLTFNSLDNLGIVKNLFSTRLGGVSSGFYSSMNLGFHNGDEISNVYENFRRIATVMDVSLDKIVRTHQTHTTNIHVVTKDDVYEDGLLHDPEYTDIDGLVCNIPGICLSTSYADCVPLYFVDPIRRVIGLSHSGWRGTANLMGAKTIEKMSQTYGSKPEDIFAAIGPSICLDCYEVGLDVVESFSESYGMNALDAGIAKPGKSKDKFQFDLWEANRQILLSAGILENHIEMAELCTCCNSDWLYSHRASAGKRGNLGAFLMLK